MVTAAEDRAHGGIRRSAHLVDRRQPGNGPGRFPVCHLGHPDGPGDIGWISYSTDHGGTWSAPLRVTSDHDNAMHNLEVAGAGPGVADVALCRSKIGFRLERALALDLRRPQDYFDRVWSIGFRPEALAATGHPPNRTRHRSGARMNATDTHRIAAAIEARRRAADQMLQRIRQALRQMRREHARITVAAVARRAAVSRTFLYQNAQARALVTAAAAEAGSAARGSTRPDPAEAGWRQRALNAEDELKRAYVEVAAQRGQIGELHGRIRDLEQDLPADGIQRILTENHELRTKLRQAAADQR